MTDGVELYTTGPSSHSADPAAYRRRVVDVARWTEEAGFRGPLVYTDNSLVDPWAAAQIMIDRTERLVPMIAVQPMYLHPYAAARMVSTIAYIYGRQVDINLVTGGNPRDFAALGLQLDHDQRYEHLLEYGRIMGGLLAGGPELTVDGRHYRMADAVLRPPMPAELAPRWFVAGSSAASAAASAALGAVRLIYPKRPDSYEPDSPELHGAGVRFGIIARDTAAAAWRIALQRFPVDRDGERHHFEALLGGTDSQWFRGLGRRWEPLERAGGSTYWLYPFHSYRVFCPYLVGSYAEVAELLAGYFDRGVSTLLVDTPAHEDDLYHVRLAVRRAEALSAGRRAAR